MSVDFGHPNPLNSIVVRSQKKSSIGNVDIALCMNCSLRICT